jgi:hypothetical protein
VTDQPLLLCCLLWAAPGLADDLAAYEDAVLALVPEHDGEVVQRLRGPGGTEGPDEVQVFRFGTQAGLDAYLTDPRRTALAAERDRVVGRTDLFPVTLT